MTARGRADGDYANRNNGAPTQVADIRQTGVLHDIQVNTLRTVAAATPAGRSVP
ncbi:hypothetical protein [Parafrankia elaeagni]|uniref:hypothetical protein n=1 Tax=Parafrankia elaeagni TaxID=222534 RepID=UPI000380358A|nr:hypothetical protein [Parafrankia elaeagni]